MEGTTYSDSILKSTEIPAIEEYKDEIFKAIPDPNSNSNHNPNPNPNHNHNPNHNPNPNPNSNPNPNPNWIFKAIPEVIDLKHATQIPFRAHCSKKHGFNSRAPVLGSVNQLARDRFDKGESTWVRA